MTEDAKDEKKRQKALADALEWRKLHFKEFQKLYIEMLRDGP